MQGKYIRLSPKPCLLPSPKSPVRRPRGDAKKCRLATVLFLIIIYLYLFLQPTEAQGFYYIICTQYSSVIGKLANKFLRFGQFVAKKCFLTFSIQNKLLFFSKLNIGIVYPYIFSSTNFNCPFVILDNCKLHWSVTSTCYITPPVHLQVTLIQMCYPLNFCYFLCSAAAA